MTFCNRTVTALLLAAAIFPWTGVAGTAQARETASQVSLDFSLPVPKDPEQAAYLGLTPADRFTLDQVSADILIVEIFSMYCPICQREAPRVNTLFKMLQKVKEKKIRIIGIGAGNSAYEVAFFKENYTIPFPLFSDGEFAIHKKIGERGTPFFIALTPKAPKGSRIFFTHSGDMGDLEALFKKLTHPSHE